MITSYTWLQYLRRGDTKGSCVRRYNSDCRCDVTPAWVVHEPWTGMKLDIHSWTEISGSEKRAPHDCHGWSSLSLFKEPFGGILSDARIVRGKNTVSVSTNPKVAFAVPMDARTCHFHHAVGYLENGCRKIRISSRMMMVMRRMMMMMLMMVMVVTMTRHCEGAAAWRDSPGIWREFPLSGGGGGSDCRCDVTPAWVVHEPWTGMKLDIHSWTEISGSEKRAPHDCHGWSSLSLFKEPFGGILSDEGIVRGKKTRSVLAQTPKSLLRYLNGCSNLSLSSHRWVRGKWMSKNPNCKSNDDVDDDDADDETLRRGCCVKRRTRHVTRVHLGGAWNWTFRAERRYLDPKREHPTMSMVAHHLVHLNSHLEVYIVRHTHRAGKKTRSVLAQTPMFLFAVPMDARTCHFHHAVGYLENGCRKIRISSRMMMVMRRMMMMMLMMVMVVTMTRHCEGAAAWRDSPGIWREFPLSGGGGALIVVVMWLQLGWFMNRGRAWNWTFIAERRYLDPKRGHPTIAMVDHHLVYLKSHLEVYCLTHASCGEKDTVSVSTNPKVAFAVPIWMLEPVTFIAPLGTGQMDVEKSELQVEWWCWWWWCWWWDTAKGLLREETHKACDESSLGVGGHGAGHSEQSGDIWIRKESTPRCP